MQIYKYFFEYLIDNRQRLLLLLAALSVLALGVATQVKINYSLSSIFDEHSEEVRSLINIKHAHKLSNPVYILVEKKNSQVLSKESAQSIGELSVKLNGLAHVNAVSNIFQKYIGIKEGGEYELFSIEDIILGDYVPVDQLIDQSNNIGFELYEKRLISTDLTQLIVLVDVELALEEVGSKKTFQKKLSAILDNYRNQYPNQRIRQIGYITLHLALVEAEYKDYITLYPLVFLVSFILLILLLRSLVMTLYSLLCIVLTLITTLAAATIIGFEFNQLTSSSPLIVMVVCLLDYIHVNLAINQGAKNKPDIDIVKQAFYSKMAPIVITKITTIAGFLSLNFSSNESICDLGNIAALGIFIGFVYLVSVYPLLSINMKINSFRANFLANCVQGITKIIRSVPYLLVVLLGSLAVIFSLFIQKNYFDDDVFKYLSSNTDIADIEADFQATFSGLNTLYVSFIPKHQGAMYAYETLIELEAVSETMKRSEEVAATLSIVDVLKFFSKVLWPNKKINKLSDLSSEEYSELLIFFKLNYNDFERDQALLVESMERFLLMIDLKEQRNTQVISFYKSIKNKLNKLEYLSLEDISSDRLLFSMLSNNIVSEMLIGSVFLFVFVSLFNWLIFKSLLIALLSLLTNLLPVVIAYGLWGMFFQEMTVTAALTFSIAFGIIVDDTIHVFYAFKLGLDKFNNSVAAIEFAIDKVGPAIIASSVVFMSGLWVLTLSEFTPNRTMSAIMMTIAGAALIYDLFFMPALLVCLNKVKFFNTANT